MLSLPVPDWALHCTENPEITVQYISDSGAVQLSRHCQDTIKEISCQGGMNQMTMYDELKCPEEQTTTTATETTTVDISRTTEESRPEVIIKNPQKMLEDIFNDVETNIEVDSNRLDVVDAKKELDLMVGDQPVPDAVEDKKTLLKISDKKEIFSKKMKNSKKEKMSKEVTPMDDEPMMGDAPAEELHDEHSTTTATKHESLSTDRERRDVMETTLAADAKISTETPSSPQSDATIDDFVSTSILTEVTTEAQQVTTVVTEETTTKFIVHGLPMFHSQVIFKEPIAVDNGTNERKDDGNSYDHFIPPMILAKIRTTATKSTEGATEEARETTTDIAASVTTESTSDGQTVTEATEDDKNVTSKPTETNEISINEIASVTQLETTPQLTSIASERPIMIEKRNDPRLGLNVAETTTQVPSTVANSQISTTELSSSTTEESTVVTDVSSPSVSYESSVSEISTTESQTELSETSESSSNEASSTTMSEVFTTIQPETTTEESTQTVGENVETFQVEKKRIRPLASDASSRPANKSKAPMQNDIDGSYLHSDHNDPSHELHEHSDNDDSFEQHQHLENSLNNAEDFQPYKPNRHRSITHPDHHHGPGFSIGKILG